MNTVQALNSIFVLPVLSYDKKWYNNKNKNKNIMVKEHVLIKSVKFVLRDILFDMVYWLAWWYTTGLKKSFYGMLGTIRQGNQELGLTIWLKNLFKPMFGQYDWQGRLISFFMRLFQLIVRSVIFLFWVILSGITFLIWILLPLFILFQVFYNTGLFGSVI